MPPKTPNQFDGLGSRKEPPMSPTEREPTSTTPRSAFSNEAQSPATTQRQPPEHNSEDEASVPTDHEKQRSAALAEWRATADRRGLDPGLTSFRKPGEQLAAAAGNSPPSHGTRAPRRGSSEDLDSRNGFLQKVFVSDPLPEGWRFHDVTDPNQTQWTDMTATAKDRKNRYFNEEEVAEKYRGYKKIVPGLKRKSALQQYLIWRDALTSEERNKKYKITLIEQQPQLSQAEASLWADTYKSAKVKDVIRKVAKQGTKIILVVDVRISPLNAKTASYPFYENVSWFRKQYRDVVDVRLCTQDVLNADPTPWYPPLVDYTEKLNCPWEYEKRFLDDPAAYQAEHARREADFKLRNAQRGEVVDSNFQKLREVVKFLSAELGPPSPPRAPAPVVRKPRGRPRKPVPVPSSTAPPPWMIPASGVAAMQSLGTPSVPRNPGPPQPLNLTASGGRIQPINYDFRSHNEPPPTWLNPTPNPVSHHTSLQSPSLPASGSENVTTCPPLAPRMDPPGYRLTHTLHPFTRGRGRGEVEDDEDEDREQSAPKRRKEDTVDTSVSDWKANPLAW